MSNSVSFKGKTVFVTGASSGIGKEFTLKFASMGANLVITSRSEQRLQDVAGDVREKYGVNLDVTIIPADLARPETPEKLFDELKEKKIHVDVLVNNAGFGHYGRFEDSPYEKTYNMNMLNVVNLVSMCRLFIPPMLEKGEGGIINISSTASFQPVPFMAAYGATKAYVLSFTQALWREYKDKGIKIMALCPGYTDTGFKAAAEFPDKLTTNSTSAEYVVEEGMEAYMRGEIYYVPRKQRDIRQSFIPLMPAKIVLDIAGDMFEPES